MPWFWVIALIAGVFVAGTVIQGVISFLAWYNERRICSQLQKEASERRRRQREVRPGSDPPSDRTSR